MSLNVIMVEQQAGSSRSSSDVYTCNVMRHQQRLTQNADTMAYIVWCWPWYAVWNWDSHVDTWGPHWRWMCGSLVGVQVKSTDSVIVVTHEPNWLLDWYWGSLTGKNVAHLIKDHLSGRCRLRLAGDLHHFMRHSALPSATTPAVQHLLVNGCGGAFLHPTHVFAGFRQCQGSSYEKMAAYPSFDDSRKVCTHFGAHGLYFLVAFVLFRVIAEINILCPLFWCICCVQDFQMISKLSVDCCMIMSCADCLGEHFKIQEEELAFWRYWRGRLLHSGVLYVSASKCLQFPNRDFIEKKKIGSLFFCK